MKKSRMSRKKFLKNESGMMAVEAVISFTAFIFVTACIIYLINIFTIHNRIQYAINEAAQEIAGYSYLYTASQLQSADKTLDKDGKPYTQPIADTSGSIIDSVAQIQKLYGDAAGSDWNTADAQTMVSQLETMNSDVQGTASSVSQAAGNVKTLINNGGQSFMIGVIYLAESSVRNAVKFTVGAWIAQSVTKDFLTPVSVDGASTDDLDSYLKKYGIEDGYAGLDFSGSSIFAGSDSVQKKMINIVVSYDISLPYIRMVMKDPKLHVIQRVTVPAWLDGDGVECQYKK